MSRKATSSKKFQSSPAPKDGRYLATHVAPIERALFQSSPAPKDGRYIAGMLSGYDFGVSILARPEGRALLHYLTKA